MINPTERLRRAERLRKWYYNLPTAQRKSQMKRKIISASQYLINEDTFYQLLRGRTYINDAKRKVIVLAIGEDIFEVLSR